MLRPIASFETDDEGHWVARLSCGHTRHVRHQPPMAERPWVLSEAGRAAMLGTDLDCVFCNMAELPPDLQAYKQTRELHEHDVPRALLADHRTKPGVWAQIVVEEGKLEYTCERGTFVLRPSVFGIVEPESPHRVRPLGHVRFFVRFLRAPVLGT